MKITTLLPIAIIASSVNARSVPQNVRNFYNRVKVHDQCSSRANILQAGLQSTPTSRDNVAYCKNDVGSVVYLKGHPGKFTDMDIDCDGDQAFRGDGRCDADLTGQPMTSFKDTVSRFGIRDLNAYIHPYVVFGNEAGVRFDPQAHGIKPLSVMAVVCGDRLVYGIWGDTNGSRSHVVGETSLALATACYGKGMNGNAGHAGRDVLYIAFPGSEAVPGKNGANWRARTYEEFEESIEELGNRLIQRLN